MVSAYRTAARGNVLCTGRASSDSRLVEICPLCRSYSSACTYGDVNQCSSPGKTHTGCCSAFPATDLIHKLLDDGARIFLA